MHFDAPNRRLRRLNCFVKIVEGAVSFCPLPLHSRLFPILVVVRRRGSRRRKSARLKESMNNVICIISARQEGRTLLDTKHKGAVSMAS